VNGWAVNRTLRTGDTRHDIGKNLEPRLVDRLPALSTNPVPALIHPFECILDSQQLILPAATEFEGHLLILHGVHAGEPADGRVQLHNAGVVLVRGKVSVDFPGQFLKAFTKMLNAISVHE
ncbi:uncharacterized protein METZ01_LOCUS241634, partial [marine metagenome]|jgi:hypothetical protein